MVREQLAAYAHDAWSGWMEYLFSKSTQNKDGTVTIPKWAADRWKKQVAIQYMYLTEEEKELDRVEADRMLRIIEKNSK